MSQIEKCTNRYPEVAILLAAGRGKRLKPYTDGVPKTLLTYKGQAIIDYIFFALENTSIRQVIMVTNYLENQLISYVNDKFSNEFEITFCHQEELLGSANALLSARNAILKHVSNKRPLLISATDYAVPISYLLDLMQFHKTHTADISVSLRMIQSTQILRSNRVVKNDDDYLTRIIEKPETPLSVKNADLSIAASLIYIVPPFVLTYADKCKKSKRGEFELPEVINLMIDSGLCARGFLQSNLVDLDTVLRV